MGRVIGEVGHIAGRIRHRGRLVTRARIAAARRIGRAGDNIDQARARLGSLQHSGHVASAIIGIIGVIALRRGDSGHAVVAVIGIGRTLAQCVFDRRNKPCRQARFHLGDLRERRRHRRCARSGAIGVGIAPSRARLRDRTDPMIAIIGHRDGAARWLGRRDRRDLTIGII